MVHPPLTPPVNGGRRGTLYPGGRGGSAGKDESLHLHAQPYIGCAVTRGFLRPHPAFFSMQYAMPLDEKPRTLHYSRIASHCLLRHFAPAPTRPLVRPGFILLEERMQLDGALYMTTEYSKTSYWREEIDELQNNNLFRVMPKINGLPGRETVVNSIKAINFSSNNYLGLAGHPQVIQAAAEFALGYGAGSTASRLIAGNTEPHRGLEYFIAQWKGTEAAVAFGSGYQANIGILSALMGRDDLILSDRLNHASIIDGCRLSRAQVKIYGHLDLNQLEDLLRLNGFRQKLVVTESVFSMDGDEAPLQQIWELCSQWGALLMVDEAHASGVRGPQGQGLASELGVVPDIQMGTLGKAVGASGAYVAGTRSLIDLLINRARSFIYSTAAPPAVAGSALVALKLIASEEGHRRRAALAANVNLLHGLLNARLNQEFQPGHIVPILIGESARTMEVSKECLENGVFAHGIRYPTVPEGTARLRFTLMSDHTPEDIHKAVDVLEQAMNKE